MSPRAHVLVTDDETAIAEGLAEILRGLDYSVETAASGTEALEKQRARPFDLLITDLKMPKMDGITLLRQARENDPELVVIVITAHASWETAVEAMKAGAFDYLAKPFKIAQVRAIVERAAERRGLRRENLQLKEELLRRDAFNEIVGISDAIERVKTLISKVAETPATVLITGETGTGKGVIAEFIHQHSARNDHPLTVVNCGALSDTLLDAELFGSEKGAFTGATEARPGMIEAADGGSLFLDEIGDIPSPAQVRLLRFLESRLFRRVGSAREREVDVRILAATHADLRELATDGRFREDLYHRLLVFELHIPPLRERQEDVLPLAESFLSGMASSNTPAKRLGSSARAALQAHSWPGNVRELAHTMERASLAAEIADMGEITPEHLALPSSSQRATQLVSLQQAQQLHVQAVLDLLDGNRQQAAEVLGVSERHLYRLLRRYSPPSAEPDD